MAFPNKQTWFYLIKHILVKILVAKEFLTPVKHLLILLQIKSGRRSDRK